jgi:hypothetical protein
MLFRFPRMVLDINNQMLTFNFSLMNETLKQKSAVDRGFKPLSVHTKDYKIGGFFCFSAKDAALMRKCKDWLTRTVVSVNYT